ncbi:hypothetical protein [Streptomyces sp. NBC_00829]|nr:hypothetical protein OG293_32510 [Streptomyces sp. NBC_00829]
MSDRRADPGNRLDEWADRVVAGLDAHEEVDRALFGEPGGGGGPVAGT